MATAGGRPVSELAQRRVRLYAYGLQHYARQTGEPVDSPAVMQAASQRAARRYPGVPVRTWQDAVAAAGLPRREAGRPSREVLEAARQMLSPRSSLLVWALEKGDNGLPVIDTDQTDDTLLAEVEDWARTYQEQLAAVTPRMRDVFAATGAWVHVSPVAVRHTWAWAVADMIRPGVPTPLARAWCAEHDLPLPPAWRVRRQILHDLIPAPIVSHDWRSISEAGAIGRMVEDMMGRVGQARTDFVEAAHSKWWSQAQEAAVRRRLYGARRRQVPGSSGSKRGKGGGHPSQEGAQGHLAVAGQ